MIVTPDKSEDIFLTGGEAGDPLVEPAMGAVSLWQETITAVDKNTRSSVAIEYGFIWLIFIFYAWDVMQQCCIVT